MGTSQDPAEVVVALVDAFGKLDVKAMTAHLAPDVEAYITNASGGRDAIVGRDALLVRIGAVDYGDASLTLAVTDSTATRDGQALVMVEVRATRPDGRTLHNHAAHLCDVTGGRVSRWWMVEALPAESDDFWRAA
ncbi:MAG: nuclear transport factor 2 family protein [Actinobacteria bacterium]|nr:nuclear transport factor 2 family protein [Actinomycetota bacterium]